jgi:hypothetical protein
MTPPSTISASHGWACMYVCIEGEGGEGGGCLPPLPTSPIPLIDDVSNWPKFRLHTPSRGRKKRQDQNENGRECPNISVKICQKAASLIQGSFLMICSKRKFNGESFFMAYLLKTDSFSISYKQKKAQLKSSFFVIR